ncbi:hypothetical protein RHGRI_011253 [Rhododendron griersonianum]|uniref:Uncharacterized protein n=1 Tax=Rhododendron griersonianum TaxID=479676 RepID=A0AAV6KLB6_9ERIC|nr:hypothetical protein RHGRI_011253 [Rhododendron griersonianum]
MPQVDLVSSRVAGGDTDELTVDRDQPDLPPESFWLSKDAEYDWFDRNAFYDRNDSTKGNSNTNPKNLNSGSQRFSNNVFKSRPSVIGLPKTQKTSYVVDATAKRKAASNMNIRLFPPKRSESIAKSTAAEPSSPKVSCMGRVRSKRGRRRRKSGTEAAERPPRSSEEGETVSSGIVVVRMFSGPSGGRSRRSELSNRSRRNRRRGRAAEGW